MLWLPHSQSSLCRNCLPSWHNLIFLQSTASRLNPSSLSLSFTLCINMTMQHFACWCYDCADYLGVTSTSLQIPWMDEWVHSTVCYTAAYLGQTIPEWRSNQMQVGVGWRPTRSHLTHLLHDTRLPLAESGVTSQLVVNKFHLYLDAPTCLLPRLCPGDPSGNHAVASGSDSHLLPRHRGFHLPLPLHPSPAVPEWTHWVVVIPRVRVVIWAAAHGSGLPVRVEPGSVSQHDLGV